MTRPAFSLLNPLTLIITIFLLLLPMTARSQFTVDLAAKHAIMLDAKSGQILYDKNSNERIPPASMSKLMTIYILFEKLANGSLKMDDTFPVSVDVWRKWRRLDGSVMFLKEGDRVTIHDLVQGIIVQSGNDACDVVAEGLAGTQENFAQWMNKKAKELGLESSHFANASGWPDPNEYMTVHDIAELARRVLVDFPQYYHFFAEKAFTYNGIRQPNRNTLLGRVEGVDGMKTGYVAAAGYGMVVSALRDGQRLLTVVNGTDSARARARESEKLINWGFRNFKTYSLVEKGQELDKAHVWLGDQELLPLVAGKSLSVTALRGKRDKMVAKIVYQDPVPAPITKGQPVAVLQITGLTDKVITVPLLAGDSVAKLHGFSRLKAAFNYLLWGASAGE